MIKEEQEKRILNEFMGMMVKKAQRVNVFLKSGVRLSGFILDYDSECIAVHDHPNGEASTIVVRTCMASITKDVPRQGL